MGLLEEIVAFACSVEGQGTTDHQNCTYTSAELRILAEQVVELPHRSVVVEIGTFMGRSAALFFKAFWEIDLDIHLVDNWSWNQKEAAHRFADLILDNFNEVPFTLHKELSARLAGRWGWAIDLLHIDGWHDLPGIEPDCQLWLPYVRQGGIAAFHDSDCPPVAYCIKKYVQDQCWQKVSEAGRTTIWRRLPF